MFHDFLVSRDLLALPIVALGIFVTVFLLVLGYVFFGWKRGTGTDRIAHLPLFDGDVAEGGEQ